MFVSRGFSSSRSLTLPPPPRPQAWNPNWHVVIGKNFGSFVTHETRCFLYFYVGGMNDVSVDSKAVMMYKAG